jgi:hypothetical protein
MKIVRSALAALLLLVELPILTTLCACALIARSLLAVSNAFNRLRGT